MNLSHSIIATINDKFSNIFPYTIGPNFTYSEKLHLIIKKKIKLGRNCFTSIAADTWIEIFLENESPLSTAANSSKKNVTFQS